MKKLICLLPPLLYSSSLTAYQAETLVPSEREEVEDLLTLSLEELMQVKIQTASKVAEKIGQVPASVVLLTRQDLQRYGYTSVAEILQHISGVYALDYHSHRGATYGVRGYLSVFSNRSMVILVNGINQVLDIDGTYAVNSIPVPVEAIDRIEVVRGPLSVIYGSGAFFGVINIITNELPLSSQGASYQASLSVGDHDSIRGFGRLSYAHPEGRMVLNVSSFQTAGLDIPYRQLESKPVSIEGDMTTRERLEEEAHYVEWSGTYQHFSANLTHYQTRKEGFNPLPAVFQGSPRKTETSLLRLGYQRPVSEQLSLGGTLTYTTNLTTIDYDVLYPGFKGFQEVHSNAYEVEINGSWKPSTQFDLNSGLVYRQSPEFSNYYDVPSSPAPDLYQVTERFQPGEIFAIWAWFTQFNYYPSPHWKWVAGLRLEEILGYEVFREAGGNTPAYRNGIRRYGDQGVDIIPRLAVIYSPNERHIVKGMYGKAINSPTFSHNADRLKTPTLPDLAAEEIETLELDYITYLTPKYMVSFNVFQNRLQNLLVRRDYSSPTGHVSMLGNYGRWITNGVELGLQAQPTEHWQLELEATYQHTEDRDHPDLTIAYSPSWLGQLKVGYQWTPQISLGLTGYYVSRMDSYFDPSLKNADGSFGRQIGAAGGNYRIFGTNIRVADWPSKGWSANLHVYNLLDQDIHYPTFTLNSWADKGTFGWGRSVMATVGYQF